MNEDGRGESSVFQDRKCRSKVSDEINSVLPISLNVDPFNRLIQHFTSLNNRSVTADEKRKLLSSHEDIRINTIDFEDENSFNDALAAAKICLENEVCSKDTACKIYLLIQSIAEYVSYIKQQNDDNVQKFNKIKMDLMDFTQKALVICDKIKMVLTFYYSERVQDHLTESEKENIESFQKLFGKFYKQLSDNSALYTGENVSINSKALNNPSKKTRYISLKSKEHQKLLTENNKLRTELAAVKEKYANLQGKCTETNVASFHCQNQARLIAILSPFLYAHRLNGQSVTEISSYLKILGYCINEQEIVTILRSAPCLFKECQSSGHTEKKRWTFCGYDL